MFSAATENRATAPLMRDYLDPSIDAQQWLESSKGHLAKVREVYLKQQTDCARLADSGARATITPIVDLHKQMLDLWQLVQNAIAKGDTDLEATLMRTLRATGLKKQEVAMPIFHRMREAIGPGVDAAQDQVLKEMAADVSPK